MNSKYYIQFHN